MNPIKFRSVEPAPMGIADYGLTSVGSPYAYNTTEFVGTMQIRSAQAWGHISVGNYNTSAVSFQLNLMLVISNGSQNVTYWIQGVLSLMTSNFQSYFGDEIMNETGAETLSRGSITGNGSVSGPVYYYTPQAASAPPGDWITLPHPANVSIELVAGSSSGVPAVTMRYSDGLGWVTFDTAKIAWARGWADQGFVVDGYSYVNSKEIFYDAEWVYCGWGYAESANNNASDISMDLEYWNGHNLQAVPNAYDMGIDTGELMGNVSESTSTSLGGGLPGTVLRNGPGTLGMLYNENQVGTLVFNSSKENGALEVNGANTSYIGGSANLTLSPGAYTVTLWNGTHRVESRVIQVVGGQRTMLSLPSAQPVTFEESGLAAGTPWSVGVSNRTFPSSSSTISVSLPNGTYPYTVTPIAGFRLNSYAGVILVAGPTVTPVNWTRYLYPVTVQGSGLPARVVWSLAIGPTENHTTGPSLTFDLPNGTYNYTVGVAYAYVPSPSNGSFEIQGAAVPLYVDFTLRFGSLSGTVSPDNAVLTVNGSEEPTSGGAFYLSLAPGRYAVTAALSGYSTFYTNVTLTPGNATPLSIDLTRVVAKTPTTPGSPGNQATMVLYAGVGVGIAAIVVVAAVAVFRRRKGKAPPERPTAAAPPDALVPPASP